jgi:carbonic anhydrase
VAAKFIGEKAGHHTDCGITCLAHSPELLAKHFGIAPGDLDKLAIADPHQAVAVDVAALKSDPLLPGGFLVSGLVKTLPPAG